MAKGRKPKNSEDTTSKEKKASIFDLISFITDQKKPWDSLSEAEQKEFNPYMINRFLSMDLFLTEAINDLQKYTVGVLSKKDVYNLYLHFLPQQRFYLKYIKSKAEVSKEDIYYLSLYYNVTDLQAEDYYFVLNKDDEGKAHLEFIKSNYHYDKK